MPDYYSLVKAGLSKEEIAKISGCEDEKTIAVLLSLVIISGLAACGNSASQTEQSSMDKNSVESTSGIEETTENSSTNVANMDVPESQPKETDAPDVQESKVLVAYFSATGTTEDILDRA